MEALYYNIAKHFKEVYFGGNWTTVNLKDTLKDVVWKEALRKIADLNTIAALTYHINYYVSEVSKVLQGAKLEASDQVSFDLPPINNEQDWIQLVEKVLSDGEKFVNLIEKIEVEAISTDFTDPKYGSYYRNLHGIIEHTYYHLGQITIIKKILR
ncbi:DUF1572 domain-containing protein [Pedobacter rhizosphaerae]|uniref:DinB superfamily protein n=1 Tax=Pedobacter rhizosphaerae TaxID=390241 RepID=A0A1H9S1H0_9SPHI|nr:DUF1572 domain-containing protein [Pedobacter rhizosphaerae]SER78203.1 hypothetical protein SAMN04488023_11655 [Pedobacter rhizosphaerae]